MQHHIVYGLVFISLFFFNASAIADEEMTAAAIQKEQIEKQISYALGVDLFEKIKKTMDLDPRFFVMGAMDSHHQQPKFTPEKIKELLASYQRLARQKQIENLKQEAKVNKVIGAEFLAENKKKPGVVTLPSGLQYKLMVDGNGPLPKITDTVECHYKGTLIDGTVFDSSYRRGKPATFQVSGVIQGWIEALQMMKVGSKWELFIPSELAYGDRGAGPVIKPGSTLVFEVEVLGIVE